MRWVQSLPRRVCQSAGLTVRLVRNCRTRVRRSRRFRSVAAAAQIGGADRAGSALGITLTATFTVAAFGPLAFGSIADRVSLDAAWLTMAATGLVGVLPAAWLRAQQRRPATEQAT